MKQARVFLIGLVMLLSISMLATAGGTQSSSSGSGGVTVITVWSNDASPEAAQRPMIDRFNATTGAEKGIRIEYTVYGADWQTAMNLAMETGREPDMFKGFTNFEEYVAAGRMLPWTEIPGIQDILDAQAPYHRNQNSMFNGVPYGVIWNGWYSGFHYNKALLQRAGYSAPPKTWAEFEEMAIAISRLAPDIYGYAMPLVWSPDFTTWMTEYFATSSVGHMYWNYTEGRYQFADFTPYFEMLARIRNAGAMFPGMESLSDDQQRAYFADGKIGFIGGAGWNVGVLYEQFPFGGANAQGAPNDPLGWDYAPMPVRDLNNVYAVPVSASIAYLVSAKVKNDRDKLNKIGEVIRFFLGDEMQTAMSSGGYFMPLRPDITARSTANRPQWISFSQSANRLVTMPATPTTRLAPEGADRVAVIGQILTGQIAIGNIRAALEDLDRRYNAAFEQAVSRGQLLRANYIDPTFETRLRAR